MAPTASTSKAQVASAETNDYLAKPSGLCCLKGSLHSGQPRGSWSEYAGVETYVVEPRKGGKSNGHALLYFADVRRSPESAKQALELTCLFLQVWGMFDNGLLVMDSFADAGYLVLGLDYFRGDPVWKHRKNRHDKTTDPGFDYEAWKAKHTAFADVAVPKWFEAVKEQYGKAGRQWACVG